jgi:hypothetical protein
LAPLFQQLLLFSIQIVGARDALILQFELRGSCPLTFSWRRIGDL